MMHFNQHSIMYTYVEIPILVKKARNKEKSIFLAVHHQYCEYSNESMTIKTSISLHTYSEVRLFLSFNCSYDILKSMNKRFMIWELPRCACIQ